MAEQSVIVRLAQRRDFQFELQFDGGVPTLLADEPPPLGQALGPSPVQLLAAAVGNCLSDSLLFALRKYKQQPEPISAEVRADLDRNAQGRLRVVGLDVTLALGVPAEAIEHLERVLTQFEGFCTVTQSIAPAIPVAVSVLDAQGARLK
ncbi:MAG: OsmC family protein [Piscinibacter sp.]|nr:OsmC family protein [Piscinibacter sp.]